MEAKPPGETLRNVRSNSDGLPLSDGMFKVEPCRAPTVQLHQHQLAGEAPQNPGNHVGVYSGDEYGHRIARAASKTEAADASKAVCVQESVARMLPCKANFRPTESCSAGFRGYSISAASLCPRSFLTGATNFVVGASGSHEGYVGGTGRCMRTRGVSFGAGTRRSDSHHPRLNS